jgi:hypothetical protein
MLRYVFRPKDSRVFRGRYRLGNGRKILDVSLDTDKRHVAVTNLAKLVSEQEAELAGLLAPKPLRDAAQKTLAEHLKDYVADLSAQKCSKKHVALARNRVQRLCTQCGWGKYFCTVLDGITHGQKGCPSALVPHSDTSRPSSAARAALV